MQVQTSLAAAVDMSSDTDRQLCVLLDTAPTERAYLQLDRWGVPYQSLFDASPEENLREIAPLLIAPASLDATARERLFAWLEQLACSAPCLCWFETASTLSRMADHLRQFHLVGLTEGQSMLMRWYDTRILPVWVKCLTGSQAAAFAGDTSAWQYVDRFGDVRQLTISPAEVDRVVDPLPAPAFGRSWVELDDAQYSLLVDAADLTILLARVRAVIPDELSRIGARDLARFIELHYDTAIAAGLSDLDRQAQYVLLALYTSGQAGEQPELKAFLDSPPAAFDSFYDGLQGLSDAVWRAGLPLWETAVLATPNGREPPSRQEAADAV